MNTERLYTIRKTLFINNALYEVVESDGQFGVRCRIYLTDDQLMGEHLYKHIDTKWGSTFKRCLLKRFGNDIGLHKFEAIAWCSPLDKFDEQIGITKARKRVDNLVIKRQAAIRQFRWHLEYYNLPTNYYELQKRKCTS